MEEGREAWETVDGGEKYRSKSKRTGGRGSEIHVSEGRGDEGTGEQKGVWNCSMQEVLSTTSYMYELYIDCLPYMVLCGLEGSSTTT